MNVSLGRGAGAAAILLFATIGYAESWELRPAAVVVPGSAEIEAGQIDDAIRILTPELDTATGIARQATLANLCVAYAMKQEYAMAIRYCDRAAVQGEASATTLNNRGVVRAVTGDYRGAIQDFQKARCLFDCGMECDTDSFRAVVRRNLDRALDRESISGEHFVPFRRGV